MDSPRPWRIGQRYTNGRVSIQSADYSGGIPHRDTVAQQVRPEDAELIIRAVNNAFSKEAGQVKEAERGRTP